MHRMAVRFFEGGKSNEKVQRCASGRNAGAEYECSGVCGQVGCGEGGSSGRYHRLLYDCGFRWSWCGYLSVHRRKGEKLNDKTVRDGTVLHIEGETEKNGETWGYTKYNGRYGYVPLEELRPSKDAELAKAGIAGSTEKETSAVNQGDASDTQDSAAGEGQGTSAGTASTGSSQAQNDEGQGTSAGTDNTGSSQAQNGEGQGTSAGMASTDESQAQRGEVQGPPAGTASTGSSQAQSGEVQGPPAADGTTEGGESADEAVTKPVNGTAATSFKEENSWYKSPFIWIGIATVLAVIGILGYHLKKR